MREKNRKESSKREVEDFFACLVVVVVINLVGQARFFIGAAIDLAISGAISTGREIVIGFSGLFLL